MRHLLISCSGSKDNAPGEIPAINRYTGVAYNVLKSYVRAGGEMPTVWIISAKFGLIKADALIPDYDLKMDKYIAARQKSGNTELLKRFIEEDTPTDLCIWLGEVYNSSIPRVEVLPRMIAARVTRCNGGGIGVMLGELKRWLYEVPPLSQNA